MLLGIEASAIGEGRQEEEEVEEGVGGTGIEEDRAEEEDGADRSEGVTG